MVTFIHVMCGFSDQFQMQTLIPRGRSKELQGGMYHIYLNIITEMYVDLYNIYTCISSEYQFNINSTTIPSGLGGTSLYH